MIRVVALVLVPTVLGFVAGWFGVSAPPAVAPPQQLEPPQLTDGRALAGAARARLEALSYGQPPPVVEIAPPPPPPVEALFRRELTALERTPEGLVVWVVDPEQPSGRRALRQGEVYRDGWRLRAVDQQTVDLTRNGETRRVMLFSPPPPEEQ